MSFIVSLWCNVIPIKKEIFMKLNIISECTDYDFKLTLEERKPKSWLKSVSAFANGKGGTLFFGVSDKGEIVGVENSKHIIGKISELIKERIEPTPVFKVQAFKQNKVTLVRVDIISGNFMPYYYKADGNMIAFIRSGDQSIQAPSYMLNELILKGSEQTYDSILTSELKDNYSFNYLSNTFYNTLHSEMHDSDIISFGLCNDKYLTRAGLLFADSNNLRQSRIFCTRWNGVDKVSEDTVLNDLEINGSILNQLDRSMDFFRANTSNKWKKENGNTIYSPDYNQEAIKEALVNAIIHRDYNVIGAEVVLNIYDDRIEITSPGGMFSGKNIPDVVDYVTESKRRNPVIADLFHRLGLMNRRGSGLANITNRTNNLFNDGKNHVFFHSDNEFFVVKIENANYSANLKHIKVSQKSKTISNDNETKVLDLIKENPNITTKEMSIKLNVSRSTISRMVKDLVENKKIVRYGANKNGYWKIL